MEFCLIAFSVLVSWIGYAMSNHLMQPVSPRFQCYLGNLPNHSYVNLNQLGDALQCHTGIQGCCANGGYAIWRNPHGLQIGIYSSGLSVVYDANVVELKANYMQVASKLVPPGIYACEIVLGGISGPRCSVYVGLYESGGKKASLCVCNIATYMYVYVRQCLYILLIRRHHNI